MIVTEQDQLSKSPRKKVLLKEEEKVDRKKLELAMQVLKDAQKDEPEDDPYTKMAKKLDGGAKKEKRSFALRHATEQEEEKKGSQSTEQEVSSGSEREMAQKLREAAAKLEENSLPLKVWSRRIKIAVVALMLLSTAFMNGLITGETHEGVVVERSFNSEFATWSNVMLTLKESWFMIVALVAYLLMSEYNRRLDEEEMHFV